MSAPDAEQFVRRMSERWRPFRHLQADEDLTASALRDYREALAPFGHDVLARAWQIVARAHRFPCWPYLAELLEAARQAQRELRPAGGADELAEKVSELVDAYLTRFLKSAAATRARQGGYAARLTAYVREAAHVQAQYALGREGVGYDHHALFGDKPPDREAEREWFDEQRRQAQTGRIDVTVPRRLLAEWKEQAEVRQLAR